MLRFLKSFGPDIIIESLEYGMINLFYKGGAFKVYFLHGFPTKRMSLARRIIIRWSQKLFCARSDSIIANSGLTKIINEEIFGMRVDGVINPGVSDEFIRLCANVTPQNRDPIVLYVGRLVKEKGIFEIASAIKDVQKRIPGSCLWIVGDGPEREALLNFLERNSVQYVYYGRTDSKKKLAEIYQSSRVFISLNQHEPFGIVYAEALLSGCVVVCPATGGHTDFSTKFTDRFRYVKNIRSISSISEAILDGVKTWSPHFIDDRTVINEFSYNDVALEILAQVNSDCD